MTQEELRVLRNCCVDDAAFNKVCAIVAQAETQRDNTRQSDNRQEQYDQYRLLTATIFDSSSVGVFVLDANFQVVLVNKAMETYFGLQRENVVGRDKRTLITSTISSIMEEPEQFVEKVFATYDNNTYVEHFDCHVLPGPGREERWLEHWSEPITTGLFVGGRIEHYTDITRRRRYEEALCASETRMRALIGAIDEIVFEFDAEGTYIDIWTTNENILLRPKSELLGKRIIDVVDREQSDHFLPVFRRVIETREPESMEYSMELADGPHHFFARVTPILTDEQRTTNVCMLVLDITDQKHTEESLAQAVQHMQAVFRAVPDLYFRLDAEGVVVDFISSSTSELFIQPDAFLGKPIQQVLPDETGRLFNNAIIAVRTTGELSVIEYNLPVRGQERYYEARLVPLENREIIAIVRNITERKRAEQEIEWSLKNKEILLKEIHHRVKNNLQIISSLLNLQTRHIIDKRLLDILTETAGRVRAMALIHEELYSARDLSHVEFSRYLRTLTSHLFQSYGVDSRNISLTINTGDISFDIDTTVTCGLIIHELVSNCLKHAFPNDSKGMVAITLTEHGNQRYTITVQDNGIGMPSSLQASAVESLGLQLVRFLVRKLDGTVQVQSDNGTIFIIHFTESMNESEERL